MGNKAICSDKSVLRSPLNDHELSLCSACSEDKPVLPRRPCDAVDRRAQVFTVYFVIPIVISVAFPDIHIAVIAASRDNTLILGVRPAYLPGWTLMSQEVLLLLLGGTIIAHTADLEEAFGVTTRYMVAIVVELTVIDVILVLRLNVELIIAACRCCTLGASCALLPSYVELLGHLLHLSSHERLLPSLSTYWRHSLHSVHRSWSHCFRLICCARTHLYFASIDSLTCFVSNQKCLT